MLHARRPPEARFSGSGAVGDRGPGDSRRCAAGAGQERLHPVQQDATGGGYHVAFDFLVNVSHALDPRWTLYGEIFTTQSFQTQYQSIYTLDAALTYALTPNMQLDFGGNFSLNGVAPKTQLYAGLSQRF